MKPPGKRWAGMTMRRHKEIGQILICVVIGLVIGTSLGVLGHFFSPTQPEETLLFLHQHPTRSLFGQWGIF